MSNVMLDPDAFREKTKEISWDGFELLVEEVFEELGWVSDRTRGTIDGGFDIRIERNNIVGIVEVKKRVDGRIGIDVVRKVAGTGLEYTDARKIFLVTNSIFTDGAVEAHEWINGNSSNNDLTIELIDYQGHPYSGKRAADVE
jgi:HJR/Mrr/RecB family endonuclease